MAKRTNVKGKPKVDMDSAEVLEISEKIASVLGENDKKAKFGIRAIVGVNGSQFALERLVEVAKLKRSGVTLKTDDGLKYRTLGGSWFKLCKNMMTGSARYRYMSLVSPKKRTNGKDRRSDRNGR
jgi:hypothetical protein